MNKQDLIRKDMTAMAERFPQMHQDYFAGICKDNELMDMTTQPFWQSMRLSKKRLSHKGLTLETTISRDEKENLSRDGIIMPQQDGNHLVGNKIQYVVTDRKYLLNGKRIKKQKEYEISHISMLQAEVEGEMAACPNCGYMSKISSFIDGCDACGSRFTVEDFATKVSGFSLEENTWKKLRRTISKTMFFLGSVTLVLVVLGIISLMLLVLSELRGDGAINSLFGLLFSLDMVPLAVKCFISLPIIYLVTRIVSGHYYKKRFWGEETIQQVLAGFSAEDFCQKLEYKLRNIHMTDTAKEVSAFATCSLEDVVAGYRDVVDCNVTGCMFHNIHKNDGGYRMNVQVTMKLTCFNGKRIRDRYEKIALRVFGKDEVVNRGVTALREYKCKNCNNSLNILEGSTCKFCDSVFDYADYDWVIESYEIEKKPRNIFRTTRMLMVLSYVAVLLLHLLSLNDDRENDNWLSLYNEVSEMESILRECYEQITMPDDLNSAAELVDSHYDIRTMKKEYHIEDAEGFAEEYIAALEDEGFVLYELNEEVTEYTLYRPQELDGEQGYFMMKIGAEEDRMEVHIWPTDTLE